jgi:hypothetical protein
VLKSFIGWLDTYLSREEPAAILKALVGLLAFAGLMGTIFGTPIIRAGAFVAVTILILSIMLILLADRQRLRREYELHRKLLERYCQFIIDHRNDSLVSIKEWKQRVFVQPNGDVHEKLTINAVTLREDVYFIRFIEGSGWAQPERFRRRVHMNARVRGANGNSGPRLYVTRSWRSDQRINSIVHFDSPITKGELIRLEVERTWPGKCLPLMRQNSAEPFYFRTSDLMQIKRAEYDVILPVDYTATYEPIGFTEPSSGFSVTAHIDPEGREVITFRAQRIPEHKDIGMRLELK